jgi:hypothetical protein
MPEMRIAFDIKLKRPGCVLIQAAMGATAGVASKFPTESWLLSPTPDMRVYPLTDDQLSKLVVIVEREVQRGRTVTESQK